MRALRVGTFGMLLGVTVLVGAGCQNKLADENKELWRQNRELQAKLSDSESQRRGMADPSEVQGLQQQLAERDAKISELEGQLRNPAPGGAADPSLAGIEVTRDDRAGTLTVNVPGDVLFDSGKSTLKESAKNTLNKIASAIKKDYAGKKVMVDGHSDSDPISKTKDKWEDNLDLSAARSRTVAHYLTGQGIDGKLVGTRAFSDTSPKGSKASSRRVEIVVATR